MNVLDPIRQLAFRIALIAITLSAAWTTRGDDIHDESRSDVVRQRLIATVESLLADEQSKQDAATTGLAETGLGQDERTAYVFDLIQTRKVVGHKVVERRYTEKIVSRPIYRMETYIKRVPVKDENGYIIGYEDVEAKRRGARIGEKKIKRLVPDPEGTIVKKVKVAQRGPGGPDQLPGEWVGNNAMALYGLTLAVPQDESLAEHAELLGNQLARHLREYGMPDRTRELAWVLMALTTTDPELYSELIDHGIEKLLLGQHREGEIAGLWGEVCVDKTRFKHAFEVNATLLKVIEELGGFDAASSSHRGNQARVMQLSVQRTALHRVARELHWNPQDPTRSDIKVFSLNQGDGEEAVLQSIVPGLAYNPLRASFGDLASTGLALRALLAAHEAGRLPERVGPLELIKNRPLRQKVWTTREAVNAAVKAVGERQSRSSLWESAIWPAENPKSTESVSEITLFNQAVALAALETAAQLPGGERSVRRYAKKISDAHHVIRPMLETLNDWEWLPQRQNRYRVSFGAVARSPEGLALGGRIPPVDLVLWLKWAGLPLEDNQISRIHARSLQPSTSRRSQPQHPLAMHSLVMLPLASPVQGYDQKALDNHFRRGVVKLWATDQPRLIETHWLLIDALTLIEEDSE